MFQSHDNSHMRDVRTAFHSTLELNRLSNRITFTIL